MRWAPFTGVGADPPNLLLCGPPRNPSGCASFFCLSCAPAAVGPILLLKRLYCALGATQYAALLPRSQSRSNASESVHGRTPVDAARGVTRFCICAGALRRFLIPSIGPDARQRADSILHDCFQRRGHHSFLGIDCGQGENARAPLSYRLSTRLLPDTHKKVVNEDSRISGERNPA
jgi:hypothetical protein